MNQYIWVGIVIGVFFVGIGVSYAIFTSGSMMERDEAKIRELILAYQNMLNNEEIEKIPTLFSEQAIFMPTKIPAIKGVEEIVLSYEHLFTKFDLELEFLKILISYQEKLFHTHLN